MKLKLFVTALLFPVLAQAHLTIRGPKVAIGKGFARTYVSLKEKAMPKEVGIEFSSEMLEGLSEHEQEFVLKLPFCAKLKPFDHAVVNWSPHGHDPLDIYGLPHFDFHFYMIPRSIQAAITCTGDDEAICMKQPTDQFIPEHYAPTPAGVPTMGWHWIDPRSPEFNGNPFTHTLIYGFYNGTMNFIEPMITRDYLKSMPSIQKDIPQPANYPKHGHYPMNYSIQFDSTKNMYRVALKDLMKK